MLNETELITIFSWAGDFVKHTEEESSKIWSLNSQV